MLRSARLDAPGILHHIIIRGIERRKIFMDNKDRNSGDSILNYGHVRVLFVEIDMARIARIVVPGMPHHITQRGNRPQETFFKEDDYREYISLMSASCHLHGVEIWAYCLMSNHVHLIAVPKQDESLRSAIGEAHRRYTRSINFRQNWSGHLWQERFASFPMNESYLLAAARYVELNPEFRPNFANFSILSPEFIS